MVQAYVTAAVPHDELQLACSLRPGEQLEARDHRGPELTAVELKSDPIDRPD